MKKQYETIDLSAKALEVFGNKDKAEIFIALPRDDMDGLSPKDFVAVYPDRVEQVKTLFTAIDQGFCA